MKQVNNLVGVSVSDSVWGSVRDSVKSEIENERDK